MRVRVESNLGLDVATGRMLLLLPLPFISIVSLSLRIGRGLVGSAIDGGGILGADREMLPATGVKVGSDPVENLRTSEGLSSAFAWPLPPPLALALLTTAAVLLLLPPLLDSFQLRR